ncbi:sialate O-acetylesterase [Edwardsiella tarda]
MSHFTHPHADARRGEYGCVAQALHIGKTLLPYLPAEAGILIVPCARGGSAFTQGTWGLSSRTRCDGGRLSLGVATPLYQDLRDRTRAALRHNPDNRLLAVIWMQGSLI